MPFTLKTKARRKQFTKGVCCASRCGSPSTVTYAAKNHPWRGQDDKPLCDRHFALLCEWQSAQ